MNGGSVVSGSDDEGSAGVEDGSAAGKSEILAVGGEGVDGGLPEAFGVDVGERSERGSVELGGVETAEGDFTIVCLIGETRDLEGGCGRVNEAGRSKGFNGGRCLLLGQGLVKKIKDETYSEHTNKQIAAYALCETHETVERNRVIREVRRFLSGDTECVCIETQASNDKVVGNDITRNSTGAISDLPSGVRVHEGRRRGRA